MIFQGIQTPSPLSWSAPCFIIVVNMVKKVLCPFRRYFQPPPPPHPCFAEFVILMSCDGWVGLPRSAMWLSAVCVIVVFPDHTHVSGSGSLWNNYSARLGIRGCMSVPARICSNCYFTNKNSCWSLTLLRPPSLIICIYCHAIQTSISLYKRYKIFNGREWKKNN